MKASLFPPYYSTYQNDNHLKGYTFHLGQTNTEQLIMLLLQKS